jgi:hypothetical protein
MNYKKRSRGEERVDDFVVALCNGDVEFVFGGEGGYDPAWISRGMRNKRAMTWRCLKYLIIRADRHLEVRYRPRIRNPEYQLTNGYDHNILYSGSRNTLTYRLLFPSSTQRSNPQTTSNTTPPSLLCTSCCANGNMLRCTSSNQISHPWNTYSLYLGSRRDPIFHFSEVPETRLRSTFDRRHPIPPLPSPAPEVLRYDRAWISGGTRNARGRLGDAFQVLLHLIQWNT